MDSNTRIYLASASPRRQALLRQAGLAFECVVPDIPEAPRAGEAAAAYVQRLAMEKAQRGLALVREKRLPIRPVLAADTEVVLDGEILGKPRDAADGQRMLRRLAGRAHQVLTGLCLLAPKAGSDRLHAALSESRVVFGALTEEEIRAYWETGEPVDKAGGYAIQGRGACFIARIEGSYTGVVGLPLYELYELLKKL